MISIALAAYNGEKYIREQVDSILVQTIQDFELVVCDDCSTDGTLAILQEYEKQDSRIHVYENDHNLGFIKNFEKAVSLCSGEYIALCDQDDIWLPEHLQFLLNNMGNSSLSCGNAELVYENGKSMKITLDKAQHFFYTTGNYLYMLLLRGCKFQGASMLVPANFAKGVLPIPDGIYHDMWFALCACMENGISYSTQVITKYRQHENNVTEQSHARFMLKLIRQFLFGGIPTVAFLCLNALQQRYKQKGKDFNLIALTLNNIKNKSLAFSDVKFLWKHYYDIGGKKTRLDFIPSLLVWNAWRE